MERGAVGAGVFILGENLTALLRYEFLSKYISGRSVCNTSRSHASRGGLDRKKFSDMMIRQQSSAKGFRPFRVTSALILECMKALNQLTMNKEDELR